MTQEEINEMVAWPTPAYFRQQATSELLELAARAIRSVSDYDFTPSRLHHRAVYGRRDPARAHEFNCVIDATPPVFHYSGFDGGLYAQLRACSEVLEPLPDAPINMDELFQTFHLIREQRQQQADRFVDMINCGELRLPGWAEWGEQFEAMAQWGKPAVVREPITQAKIDRVFGLSKETEQAMDKGARRMQFARLVKRWEVTRQRLATPEEMEQLRATFKAQGFEE